MKKNESRRYGFCQGHTYPAIVKRVKKDRVFFTLTNNDGEEYEAVYYIHGELINPFTAFKTGEEVRITLLKLNKDTHLYCGARWVVEPEMLPIDVYILNHPLGSIVNGVIDAIKGNQVIISLDNNVKATVKRFRNAHTGQTVTCQIEKYNTNKRYLAIKVY